MLNLINIWKAYNYNVIQQLNLKYCRKFLSINLGLFWFTENAHWSLLKYITYTITSKACDEWHNCRLKQQDQNKSALKCFSITST